MQKDMTAEVRNIRASNLGSSLTSGTLPRDHILALRGESHAILLRTLIIVMSLGTHLRNRRGNKKPLYVRLGRQFRFHKVKATKNIPEIDKLH